MNSPAFVVRDKFIECTVCGKKSIGLDVLQHATGHKHQAKLCKYITPPKQFADACALPLQQEGLNLAEALAAAEVMKASKEEREQIMHGNSRKRSRSDE